MNTYEKPVIIISKCLNDNPCRYNGESCRNKFVLKLDQFIKKIEICPEVGIGLTTPRNAIRLVQDKDKIKIIDPKNLIDYTAQMTEFAEESYLELKKIKPQGFIFKTKSPSCGINDANIYSGTEKIAQKIRKDAGMYSGFIKNKFPLMPIEDDGRLNNFIIRENFLIKIFTLANFEAIKIDNNIGQLLKFHTKNKLLFMGYNQTLTKELGNLIASHGKINPQNIFLIYEMKLLKLLSRSLRYTSMINVFTHAYGYFSKFLRTDEKEFFFDILDKYREGKCPQCVIINLLKGYAYRFNNEYLLNQTLLSPYPEELMDFSDSGKGITRD